MSTNGKPKFAMYWAASCGGCEIAVLNIHEKILDDANFEVVFWPVAMDKLKTWRHGRWLILLTLQRRHSE
jgi:coenzyme F420-reducing hydrogenase gamma subunit